MTKLLSALWLFAAALTMTLTAAQAQQGVWVQVEAQPSLREATERARAYAAELPGVSGFALNTGWYGIVLGPFERGEANRTLAQLRAERRIPRDSFIAAGNNFQRQFWPVGAAAITSQPITPETPDAAQDAAQAPDAQELADALAQAAQPEQAEQAETVEQAPPAPVEETPAEARRAERALDRPAREALQVALQWEGFYTSAIDGAFGPGTRRAMAQWQEAQGLEPTGVLTTKQRAALLGGYQSVLDALALRPVTDDTAGITIDMPTGMVAFDRYEPPFAHYKSTTDDNVRVVLISQTGDADSLGGLYDIMQTLEIMPLEGERSRDNDSFVLTGANSSIVSHAQAQLRDGAIKGFVLIWPAGDEKRRKLAVQAMQASFAPVAGAVLPDVYGAQAEQSIDLLSGLEFRKPDVAATGFYVDASGQVLTAASTVAQCGRIMLDDEYEASIVATSDRLALLKPIAPLAPLEYARFQPGVPRLNSEVAVAGYSYGGRLPAPVLTYGALAELQGLDGAADVMRLTLAASGGDAGGPLYDGRGAVLGMLLDGEGSGRVMPEGVAFAADMQSIVGFLTDNGVTPAAADATRELAPEDLIKTASGMTVLVGCFE